MSEETAPEDEVYRRSSQSELDHCSASHCNHILLTTICIRPGHLPEGRVLRYVVEKGDRPKEGHLRAVPTDPKVEGHRVKREVLPLLRGDRRHQQGPRAHLRTEDCRRCLKIVHKIHSDLRKARNGWNQLTLFSLLTSWSTTLTARYDSPSSLMTTQVMARKTHSETKPLHDRGSL